MTFSIKLLTFLAFLSSAFSEVVTTNRITGALVDNFWMESGFTNLDDVSWVTQSTFATSFTSPIVFISLPDYGDSTLASGYPLSVRIRNIAVTDGSASFEFKVDSITTIIFHVLIHLS